MSVSEAKCFVLYSGHFVWKRELKALRAAAGRRQLVFEHESQRRLTCVRLTITVRGKIDSVSEFAAFVDHWYGGRTPDAALGRRPEAH